MGVTAQILYGTYVMETTQQLNALPDASFRPGLNQLDALIESIMVVQ